MSRTDFDLTNFTAGELSPRLKGRTDYVKYFNGAAGLQNFVVMPQGGITRRPGTEYIEPVWLQSEKPRLRRFQFSTDQAYILEMGAGYIRVYANDAQVVNPQNITSAANNGAGLIRLTLASAAGIYTGNTTTVAGVLGTVEANGTWTVSNVELSLVISGAADNGNGLVRITVGSTADLINGGVYTVSGVTGTVEANGVWAIEIADATHVDLQGSLFVNAFAASSGTIAGNDAFKIDLQGSAFVHAYTSGGVATTIVQIPTPYAAADLATLYFTQSDDTLFITHKNYPPASFTRSSNVAWTYKLIIFRDGPYLDINATTTRLTVTSSSFAGGQQIIRIGEDGLTLKINPGTTTRSHTITASSTLGINATPQNVGQGFLPSDQGRHLRIKLLASWAWLVIEQVVSATEVIATVQPSVVGGAWGQLDGAAWADNTYYPVGVVVTNDGGKLYSCVQAGYSASSGGPTGTGSSSTTEIADSTVVWNYITGVVPTGTTFWQLGKWTPGINPYVCSFWQQRLIMMGSDLQPNAIEASVTGDFTNFAPTAQDGSVVDTNALSFVISDDQVNAVQWVKTAGSAQAAQLAIGTPGAEQIMQAYSTAQPLTPSNVQVYSETTVGSAPIEPLRIGKSLLFVDRPGRKLIEWTFLWQVNGYDPVELSQNSEHITQSGVVEMVYAQAPHRLVCLLLENGTLVFASYNKDEQVFAPTRQVLGGNYYGGPPIVESIEVIPSPDLSYDEIWLAVLRTVGGEPFRSIEVLTRWFENATVPQENAVFADASLSLTLPAPATTLTVSGLANTQVQSDGPPSWTGAAMLTAGVTGVFSGELAGALVRVNGGIIQIDSVTNGLTATGVVLRGLTSLAPAAAGAWTMAPVNATVSGLDYLDGETVGILGDGGDLGTAVVTAGSVPIPPPGATVVTVGLPYVSSFVGMPYEPQRAAAAVTQGKAKRIDSMWVRFFESLGCNFGQRLTDALTFQIRDKTEALETRAASMAMGQAPSLFTGARKLLPQGGFDQEGQMLINTNSMLPLTVLSIFARADVGDMPRGQG